MFLLDRTRDGNGDDDYDDVSVVMMGAVSFRNCSGCFMFTVNPSSIHHHTTTASQNTRNTAQGLT